MPLELIYITNNPEVAKIAQNNGVDRVMVDLETLGKEERQKNMNTVKSHHSIEDVAALSKILNDTELLVRINPWNENSAREIEDVINAGAKRIMLPMWKCSDDTDLFLKAVNGRTHTMLLLETKEGAECIDSVLENPLIDEVYIGLNDLHLSYGMDFMFEPLANGMVEKLCSKIKVKGKQYGFGGVSKIGEGTLPAEKIVAEHYRLGSTRVILSRSFCNAEEIKDIKAIGEIFEKNVKALREYEKTLSKKTAFEYEKNRVEVEKCVSEIVRKIKEKKSQ